MKLSFRTLFIFLSLTSLFMMWSGCTARRVPKGQKMIKRVFLVNKVTNRDSAKAYGSEIDPADMYGYVKQKPNRKLFGVNLKNLFRWHMVKDSTDSLHVKKRLQLVEKGYYKTGAGYPLYLAIHNLVNPKREAKRQERRANKLLLHPTKKMHKTIGEILYNIGESPVILDTNSMHRTTQQMEMYLDNKGYFRSNVTDSIAYPSLFKHHILKHTPDSVNIFGHAKKKVIVYYIAKPAHVYTIDTIRWEVRDPNMEYDVFNDTAATLLHRGEHYDLDLFEAERDRIVKSLRNNGYFTFTRDYVSFEADTSVGDHRCNMVVRIKKREVANDTGIVEEGFKRYYVQNITVRTIYDPKQLKKDETVYDTVVTAGGIVFLRNTAKEEKLRFRPAVIEERILFRPGNLYQENQFEETYSELTGLHVFRQVVITPAKDGNSDQLNVQIYLFTIPKQNFTSQVEGTNTGGYLGIGGSFAYQNNNLDRGAELLEFRVKGGTEAQQPLAQTQQVNAADQLTFNTIELGAEVSLNIPRAYGPFTYLPLKDKKTGIVHAESRRTSISTSVNYQRRVDYDRLLMNFSVGYTYKAGKWNHVGIYPFEVNVVKVNPRQGLIDLLAHGDILLQYRFTDHLINDCRVSFTHNEQLNKQKKWRPFFKLDAEMSGFAPFFVMQSIHAEKDNLGSYRIGGIPFSHYIRIAEDIRVYRDFGDHQTFVARLAIGTGFPQKNFRTLPLEKSFFGGGANGIRAWEARSLGPGSLNVPADEQFAQFGEVQIEYNLELRFRITKSLLGALFADGGNIWLLPSAAADEAAEFQFKDFKFINDLAFGPGFGIRYDLSFFIVRLDLGFKVRDPSKPYGERWWWFTQSSWPPGNLNFGIGYPF